MAILVRKSGDGNVGESQMAEPKDSEVGGSSGILKKVISGSACLAFRALRRFFVVAGSCGDPPALRFIPTESCLGVW